MNNVLNSLIFRPPTIDDAEQILDFLNQCDIAEYGDPDSDLEDILQDWSHIDLTQDAWLVITPDGKLTGYATVIPWGTVHQYEFYVAPTWKDENLGVKLLANCETRGLILAKEFMASTDDLETDFIAKTYIAHVNKRDKKSVLQRKFELVKHHFNMQIDLDTPFPTPNWPEGVSLRTFIPQQDEEIVYNLIQTAFDRPGRTPQPYQSWLETMVKTELFNANLWFIATVDEEIIGACLNVPYAEQGWVRQLGVAKNWQKKGIGSALLHHTFAEFKKRGFTKVGLAVDGTNTNAYTFYENSGMKRRRQYGEYVKKLDIGRET